MEIYEFMKVIDVAVIFYVMIAACVSNLVYTAMEGISLIRDALKKRREKKLAAKQAAEETAE